MIPDTTVDALEYRGNRSGMPDPNIFIFASSFCQPSTSSWFQGSKVLVLDDVAQFKCTTKIFMEGNSFTWILAFQATSLSSAFHQAISRSDHNSFHVHFHFQQSKQLGLVVNKVQASTKQTCGIPSNCKTHRKKVKFSCRQYVFSLDWRGWVQLRWQNLLYIRSLCSRY